MIAAVLKLLFGTFVEDDVVNIGILGGVEGNPLIIYSVKSFRM